MGIVNLVNDWGGFEKLVAELHETGEVTVEHNVVLTGKSGAPRQFDVVIRHKQGLYDHLVIAECKYWNSAVERLHIDALATAIQDVGASRGVLFSTKGFQSGAVTQAKHSNIDLYTVRDLTAEEWGLPGQVVDLFVQAIQPSISNPVFHDGLVAGDPSDDPIIFSFHFGKSGPLSSTPLLLNDGTRSKKTVEMCLAESADEALRQVMKRSFILNGGMECTRYLTASVDVNPTGSFKVPFGERVFLSPRMSFDLGIKICQGRVSYDRAQQYKFALALENCVNGKVSSASRSLDETVTTVAELTSTTESREDAVKNGSVVQIFVEGYFQFSEMNELTPIPIESVTKPLPPR